MFLLLLAVLAAHAAPSAIPEDLCAFPKYRLSFLPARPLPNATATRWLRDGLPGGEQQFLDVAPDAQQPPQRIDGGPSDAPHPAPALEHVRLGPAQSYLCLVPPAPAPPAPHDEPPPRAPSHSWALLDPLADTCLYHRQAWFTYAYCHNLHVRQFRELPATYPHPPGARVVEEDPEWEAYTLGRAPTVAVQDDLAHPRSLELARQGAGQRYLVQRWADGTLCDKTGRPREIEIQFHCSMTMTDTILFVKETRTCEYVLVIHTPRLCAEPGFKSRFEQMPEAHIRCRRIVPDGHHADVPAVDPALPEPQPQPQPEPEPEPESPHPFTPAHHRTRPLPSLRPENVPHGPPTEPLDRAQETAQILRKALESILGRTAMEDLALVKGEQDGEYFLLDPEQAPQGQEQAQAALEQDDEPQPEPVATGHADALKQALRAAGFDVQPRERDAHHHVRENENENDETGEPPRDEL